MIHRIEYRNNKMTDFEIITLQDFFAKRPSSLLERDFRLDFWALMFITRGTGTHSIDFVDLPYSEGSVIFIQKNQVHRFHVNKEAEGYLIHINEPLFYQMEGFDSSIFLSFTDEAFGTPVLPFSLGKESTNRALLELIHKEYAQEPVRIELIASLFQSLILSLREERPCQEPLFQTRDYDNFRKFRALLEENFTRLKGVEDYSKLMLCSVKTIHRATKKLTGLTAKQFIIQRIILEIKRSLSQGDLLNYEIAEELGFDEPANMSSFFTHYTGQSPRAFRNCINPKNRSDPS